MLITLMSGGKEAETGGSWVRGTVSKTKVSGLHVHKHTHEQTNKYIYIPHIHASIFNLHLVNIKQVIFRNERLQIIQLPCVRTQKYYLKAQHYGRRARESLGTNISLTFHHFLPQIKEGLALSSVSQRQTEIHSFQRNSIHPQQESQQIIVKVRQENRRPTGPQAHLHLLPTPLKAVVKKDSYL